VLAERLSLLTGPDQALSGAEQRLEEIERRAGHAFADLGARAADLDARCGAIDAVLTAAARGADAVDRRAATLAAPDQPLGQAELRCENLEQRGAQALADFATRASELDAGRQAIELALGKAKQQIQELEDRLASFTVPDEA
jgi:prefoldin subunit 5